MGGKTLSIENQRETVQGEMSRGKKQTAATGPGSEGVLGIVAGAGSLPLIALEEALRQNRKVVFYPIDEEFDQTLPVEAQGVVVRKSHLGRFFSLLGQMKKDGVTDAIIIGKIHKDRIFKKLKFDLKTLALLAGLKNRNDKTIFQAIADNFTKAGITLLPQRTYLSGLLLSKGVYSKKKPDKRMEKDIRYGLYYARKISELDIGQSVVVFQKTLLAVEAAEGTDEAVLRGGGLVAGGGAVLCKARRADQDERFDLPTVGFTTLEVMKKSGCRAIAVEADTTFIVNPEKFIEKIDSLGLVFVCDFPPSAPGG